MNKIELHSVLKLRGNINCNNLSLTQDKNDCGVCSGISDAVLSNCLNRVKLTTIIPFYTKKKGHKSRSLAWEEMFYAVD